MTRFDTLADQIFEDIGKFFPKSLGKGFTLGPGPLGKGALAAGTKNTITGAVTQPPTKGNFLDQWSKKMDSIVPDPSTQKIGPLNEPDLPVVGGDRDRSILATPEPDVPDMMRWDPLPAKGENPAYDPRTGKSLGPNTAAFNKKYGVQRGTPRPTRPRPTPTPVLPPRATPPPLNLDPSKGPVG